MRFVKLVAFALLAAPYIFLRAMADASPMPHQDFTAFERVGGMTLGERLQGLQLDGFFLAVHASWFTIPPIVTVYVLIFWPQLFSRYVFTILGVLYVSVGFFFLMPTEPPWMHGVPRVMEAVSDANALSAFPSLHVAVPMAITFVLRRSWMAIPLGIWASLIAVGVMYLGKHHTVDVLAAIALAYTVAAASEVLLEVQTPLHRGVRRAVADSLPDTRIAEVARRWNRLSGA